MVTLTKEDQIYNVRLLLKKLVLGELDWNAKENTMKKYRVQELKTKFKVLKECLKDLEE